MLTGKDSRLSLRYMRSFDSVVFLQVSVLLRTVIWLVEQGARISVWGVDEVAGIYLRLCVLFPSFPAAHLCSCRCRTQTFTLSRGPAYRVPMPLFYFSSIY
jgi:hypothetical protein